MLDYKKNEQKMFSILMRKSYFTKMLVINDRYFEIRTFVLHLRANTFNFGMNVDYVTS